MEILTSATTPRKSHRLKNSAVSTPGLRISNRDNIANHSQIKSDFRDHESPRSHASHESEKLSLTRTDRFIPNRNKIDFDYCNHSLLENFNRSSHKESSEDTITMDPKVLNTQKLKEEYHYITNHTPGKRLVDCFENKCESKSIPIPTLSDSVHYKHSKRAKSAPRILPTMPYRILDAPALIDDYYLNLLSWGHNNILGVALDQSVYLWHPQDERIETLCCLGDGEAQESDEQVTSIQWSNTENNTLAIGTSNNQVQIWDCSTLTKVRDLHGHTARVSSLSWNCSNGVLSTAGRDSCILNHDLRTARSVHSSFLGHQQEVCGLAWSQDGTTLASGGNENVLCLWDNAMNSRNSANSRSSLGSSSPSSGLASNSSSPRYRISAHQAAVKALAWCPFQRNVLASGGGTADRSIRIWNTSLGTNLHTVDTGSQVCAMQWSDMHRELVTSHGFSDNQLILWKYNTTNSHLNKLKEFRGHTARVLHMAKSPDGTQIVTAGADETLRFWDMFSSTTAGYNSTGACSPNKDKSRINLNQSQSWGSNSSGGNMLKFNSPMSEGNFSIR